MSGTESELALRDSMQRYGKYVLDEKEQIKILYLILEDAREKLCPIKLITHAINHDLIKACQEELKTKKCLQDAIAVMNRFIVNLEARDSDGVTVGYLKNVAYIGFYIAILGLWANNYPQIIY